VANNATQLPRSTKSYRRLKSSLMEAQRKAKVRGYFVLLCFVVLLCSAVVGAGVYMKTRLGIDRLQLELSKQQNQLALLSTTFEEKMLLYNIIDKEARDAKGRELLTPAQKRVAAETMLEGVAEYGKRGQTLALYCAIIEKESNWNPRAVSPVWEARGLMQIIDSTMKQVCDELFARGDKHMLWTKPEDSYDVERNLRAGFYYLDKIHMFNVRLGHEKIDSIGWMTLYEYYAGSRALKELQSSRRVEVRGMGHPKSILEAAQQFTERGLQ